ncbi:MAG: hypothetical protein WC980_09430 [Candidatus Brocadiia bacterium]
MLKTAWLILATVLFILPPIGAEATPSTHIWTPSTDIQPYKKIHLTADWYVPNTGKDDNGNSLHVLQVYGPTFSLLSDKPEDNLLGKIWSPLGKIMAETGFDYKKGLGTELDKSPLYLHYKFAAPEDAYFKGMPALAIGEFDMGTKQDETNNNVFYLKAARTFGKAGRFSAGYFTGNKKLLLDGNGAKDNAGLMFTWERTMTEISDKLWLCLDYQATQSAYGALNYGFSWKFNDHLAAIAGYDRYNNSDLTDTITLQLDVDF